MVQNGQSVVEAVVLSPARTDQCSLCEVMLGDAYLISCLVITTVVISFVLCQVMLGEAYLISCLVISTVVISCVLCQVMLGDA